MQRALELALLGKGSVAPNPMVGCVVVHDGKIIGEGFHQKYGNAHAEVNAINSVEDQLLLKQSTVFVTLEPCAHFGKTPPCSDLLIDKGVKRVVISCRDPFKMVDGKGIEKLKTAGIEVSLGLLEKEAIHLNRRFFTYHTLDRPYVILKWAETFDGFMAKSNYDSKWISSAHSRQIVHKWRSEEDAILVGKNTAIHDNPSLTVRDWKGSNPTRILLDSDLEVPESHKLFDGNVKTIVMNKVKDEEKGHVLWMKLDSLDPSSILNVLYQQRIQSVIVEGGSKTLNSFIRENCWDEARIFKSESRFESGISAPVLRGKLLDQSHFKNDELLIYQNNG